MLQKVESPDDKLMNLSLSGCGFLGVYHVGVVAAFREHAPAILQNEIAGCSAGALVAACALCNCCLGEMCSDALEIAIRARSRALGPLHPTFNIVDIIRQGLRRILPTNAHEICSNRLHVSLTRWRDSSNVVVKTYATREELIQVLICSSFVPYWSGMLPEKYGKEYYWDGGLTNNNPKINGKTIFVSPFAGESDICPRNESGSFYSVDFLGTNVSCTQENFFRVTHALFPPEITVLENICRDGYNDGIDFLRSRNMLNGPGPQIKTTVSSVFDEGYTEPPRDEEMQLAKGGIAQDITKKYEEIEDDEDESVVYDSDHDDNLRQSDDGISTSPSTAEFSPFCKEVKVKRELPGPIFTSFANAMQKEYGAIGQYFTKSRAFSALSFMVLPVTLPIECACTATKKVMNNFLQLLNTYGPSRFFPGAKYALPFIIDETDAKSHYHVDDCECTERHKDQVNSSRKKNKRDRPISTTRSYISDSLTDNDDVSSVNNDDIAIKTNPANYLDQLDAALPTQSNGAKANYLRCLQQLASVSEPECIQQTTERNNK